MTERKRGKTDESGAAVRRQDAPGVDVPAGRSAGEVAPEDVRPAPREAAEPRGEGRTDEAGDEREVVASAHGEATPERRDPPTRPVGNTDRPVTSRIPPDEE